MLKCIALVTLNLDIPKMNPLRLLRGFTSLGSVIMIVSFLLPWQFVPLSESGGGGARHPLAILFLGIALLILSLLPIPKEWRSAMIVVSRLSSALTYIIIIWLVLSAMLSAL